MPTPSSKADAVAVSVIDESIESYGDIASSAEEKEIVPALRAFMEAKADGRYQRACSLSIAYIRNQLDQIAERAKPGTLERKGCPGGLEAMVEPLAHELLVQATQIDVALIKVDGGEAFVVYSTPGVRSEIMYLKREGGEWKVGKVNADRLL